MSSTLIVFVLLAVLVGAGLALAVGYLYGRTQNKAFYEEQLLAEKATSEQKLLEVQTEQRSALHEAREETARFRTTIERENAERRAGQRFQEVVHHAGYKWEGGHMRVDGDARAEVAMTPFQEAFLGDRTIDELQVVFLGEAKPFITEGEALSDGVLLEVAIPGVADFSGMNLKIGRARQLEAFINSGLEVFFQCQPDGFRNYQSTQDENRLDGIPQVRAGLAGFIEVNQVHGQLLCSVKLAASAAKVFGACFSKPV